MFKHHGLDYKFRYHKAKLGKLASNYPGLVRYLKCFESGCPSEMFEGGERCSGLRLRVDIKKSTRRNQACRVGILKAIKDNRRRHEGIEEFMLINDKATIACEIPIWLWEKNMDIGVSGHIDILQIRQGRIYILDFKPNAAQENEQKVVSQLYLYALGLSFRTGIPLRMFRCAWFDEKVYYEFDPAEAKVETKKLYRKRGRMEKIEKLLIYLVYKLLEDFFIPKFF
ncbi:MAG: hypothetical protein DRN16_04690 [Thermoplasmata archaeon]|nr:MAG: hypothetical protein DRN16_04690 [Thermoplasmata archaeon]